MPLTALVPSVQGLSLTGKASLLPASSCTSLEEDQQHQHLPPGVPPSTALREREEVVLGWSQPWAFRKMSYNGSAQGSALLWTSRRNHPRQNFPRPALPWHPQTSWVAGRPIPGCEWIPPQVSQPGGTPHGGCSQARASSWPLLPPRSQCFRHHVPEPSSGRQQQEVQQVVGTGLRTGG